MALNDPIAVYNAANNIEAHLLANLLTDQGIEAFAVDDSSRAGFWMLGVLPEIHKPQVWVERAEAERARAVLAEYEQKSAERQGLRPSTDTTSGPIDAVCEECGGQTQFPPEQRGSVQQCPHCGAYMDVGEVDENWDSGSDEEGLSEKTE